MAWLAAVIALAPAAASAWPCSVLLDKTVALDDDCDGVADGAFVNSVTQEADQCVVYRVCVTNPASDAADTYPSDNLLNVTVNDATIGATLSFGTIAGAHAPAPGNTECQYIPADAPARACATDPDSCVCTEVEGTNTATLTAECDYMGGSPCVRSDAHVPAPVCTDTATVACTEEEGCLTRTPGYWGTHPNVTASFLDVTSCGLTLSTTLAATQGSVTEDICSVGTDAKVYGSPQEAQLVRQCAAAALNLAASSYFGFSCTALTEARFEQCCGSAAACASVPAGCISDLDAFNNSADTILVDGSELSLCHELGLSCRALPEQCQLSSGNGFINAR